MSSFTNQVFPGQMRRSVLFSTTNEDSVDDHREYKGKKFMFVSYCPKEKIWQNLYICSSSLIEIKT